MKKRSSQLVHLLIAKSILETVLVAAIAVGVYMNAFPPTFRGWGEAVAETQTIAGWVVNDADPWQRIEVQLFVDGEFRQTQVAHHPRPDVAAAGWAKDEWHGYVFNAGGLAVGTHEARVYALHRSREGGRFTLQMLGYPIRFEVKSDGSWAADSH
jgi:hypothetical protein